MKKILSFVAAALVLASCQSDEFTANVDLSQSNEAISFGVNDVLATRGTTVGEQAAKLLNNNFIVYGYKLSGTEDGTADNDQKVFDLYNVNYETGSADLTQSNTNDWEYVGYNPATGSGASAQTIKYWDYSAKGYVFSAVSGLDVTASKVTTGTNKYQKGWNITIPAGGSLVGLYASNRVDMPNEWSATNDTWRFTNPVKFQFYSIASKVRFAMYETVSGYSVKVDKFYYGSSSTETNFAVTGKFMDLDNANKAVANVTYYSPVEDSKGVGKLNCPKVKWTAGTQLVFNKLFGTNIQCNTLGTTSIDATYDQAKGEYTYLIPYQNTTNTLSLKVDYTLTSTDGSGEEIHVYGATATVPANYTQWKENFAYTYLFKISDKTNGSTVPGGPEGLYPITFDACIVDEEVGIQETVTSLGEPAITTYAEGEVATKNADYAAGDVYFSATQAKALMDLSTTAKVYEVYNYGKGEITEALVADYEKNKVVLVPVATAVATAVPLKDGSSVSFSNNNCYKFAAAAGKTYAIQVNYDGTKYAYKLVKVVGTPVTPTYTANATTATVTAVDGKAVVELKAGETGVVGAAKNVQILKSDVDVTAKFNVTETADAGKYEVALTAKLVADGANGDYTVKFNDVQTSFNVNLTYKLAWTGSEDEPAKPFVVVAGNKNTFTLTVGDAPLSGAVIENTNTGITVKETTTPGTYEVSAAKDVAYGSKTLKAAGQSLSFNVDSYKFTNDVTLTFKHDGTADPKTLNMKKNAAAADVEVSAMTGINTSVATIAKESAGAYTVTAVAYGSYTVTYENASAKITVNKYTAEVAATSAIAKGTGSTNITIKLNGEVINASKAAITEDGTQPGTYSLTTNGKVLSFGNATATGTYSFFYVVNSVKVAKFQITVN